MPELPEFRLNLNKRYQLRCVPNRPIIINPISYRTKQLNRNLVVFIPAFINLLIYDFYDFNFYILYYIFFIRQLYQIWTQ
jgi:hypothetical protein